jgi:hypothetical protein
VSQGKKKGTQPFQPQSSPLKPTDPSPSRGKQEAPDASQNKDILMAALKAMKIVSQRNPAQISLHGASS